MPRSSLAPCGVPETIEAFREAGATEVMLAGYGSLLTAGAMGSAAEGSRRLAQCFDYLRTPSGQPIALPELATT